MDAVTAAPGGPASSTLQPRLRAVGAGALRGLLDFLLPAQCPVTRAPVDRPGDLAPAAWRKLHFLDAPICDRCGVPFAFDQGPGAICGACAAEPPVFEKARSAVLYSDESRPLVLAFKNGGRTDTVRAFSRWMARAGREALEGADLLVPVPLHWRRLFKRRFNQSAMLAMGVGREAGVPVCVDALTRRRSTPTQGGLSASARRRNVSGAFAVRPSRQTRLEGAIVVLVDDVLTSGATLNAAATALRKAGAAEVRAVTLARVPPPGGGALEAAG